MYDPIDEDNQPSKEMMEATKGLWWLYPVIIGGGLLFMIIRAFIP